MNFHLGVNSYFFCNVQLPLSLIDIIWTFNARKRKCMCFQHTSVCQLDIHFIEPITIINNQHRVYCAFSTGSGKLSVNHLVTMRNHFIMSFHFSTGYFGLYGL
jgi:hypothetical protein